MNTLADVIATRTIDVLDTTGRPVGSATILIGRPKLEPTGEWGCPYQVIGLDSDRPFRVFGADAVQALQNAMVVIGGTLAGTTEAKEGRLRFAGGADLGFPVPPDGPVTG